MGIESVTFGGKLLGVSNSLKTCQDRWLSTLKYIPRVIGVNSKYEVSGDAPHTHHWLVLCMFVSLNQGNIPCWGSDFPASPCR